MPAKIIALAVPFLLLSMGAGHLLAQNITVTYQGRVTSGGTPFTGTGQFKFALVTAENTARTATATPTTSGGFLTIITVTFGGSGYVMAPTVAITGGGGSGAVARANLIGDVVGSIMVINPGSGYTGVPVITIADPPERLAYTTYWNNEGSLTDGEPATAVPVSVNNGVFAVVLGDTTLPNMSALPSDIFDTRQDLRLRMWFSNGANGFAELDPAQKLGFTPYAAFAQTARSLVGSADGQPLEILVGPTLALRLEPVADGFTISFGFNNPIEINSERSTIGGGSFNRIEHDSRASTITGGDANRIGTNASFSTISGGGGNRIGNDSYLGTVSGGSGNQIGNYSHYSTISGGTGNRIGTNSFTSTISGGLENQIGTNSLIGTISGGGQNHIGGDSYWSTIGGGSFNRIGTNSFISTINGGGENLIGTNSFLSTIGGGSRNQIGADSEGGTIGGGEQNRIAFTSSRSTISGGRANRIGTNSMRSTISGGDRIEIGNDAHGGTIAGGEVNFIRDGSSASTIGGGGANLIGTNCDFSTISGGTLNVLGIGSIITTISGGRANRTAGGSGNTISGGEANQIGNGAEYSAISGGSNNRILDFARFAMVAGGVTNEASDRSFAAGTRAKARHSGSFVWGDSSPSDIASSVNDSVTMRAAGGYRLFSNSGATAGVSLAPNGTAWGVLCNRNAKRDFAPIDAKAILERLAGISITQWRYTWETSTNTPHIGPMAQDFKEAFYPGTDDKTITTLEFDGVALAAIQGLNLKLEETRRVLDSKDTEMRAFKQRNDGLEARVAELEKLLRALAK